MKKKKVPAQPAPGEASLRRTVFLAALALMVLDLLAMWIDPPYLIWGVALLRFLPAAYIAVPLAGIAASIMVYRGSGGGARAAARFRLLPYFVLFGLLAAAALVANVDAFILGDGENILFQIANKGELKLVREPLILNLAQGIYGIAAVVAPHPDTGGMSMAVERASATPSQIALAETAVNVMDLLFLALCFYAAWRIASFLYPNTRAGVPAALFLLGSGYLALFAGYAEYYCAAVALNLLFFAFVLLAMKDAKYMWGLAVVYAAAFVAYVGMIVYLPVFLLALWFGSERSFRRMLPPAGASAILIAGLFLAIGYSPSGIWAFFFSSTETSSSHIIPFFEANSIKHAYTAFSIPHAVDLANLLLLVNPVAVGFAVAGLVAVLRKRYRPDRTDILLGLGLGCSAIMMFSVNCDIGMVADWDLLAPFSIPFVVFAIRYISRRYPPAVQRPVLLLCALPLVAHTALWMATLSRDDSSIARMQALQNPRTFSADGLHYTSMNMMRFYGRTGQVDRYFSVMKRLTSSVLPDDPRGYFTLAHMYTDEGRDDLAFDILKRAQQRRIADYRIDGMLAKMLRERGDPAGAVASYRAYLAKLPPGFSDSASVAVKVLYMGVCHAQLDETEQAEKSFREALRWDPKSHGASLMLAQMLMKQRRYAEAIPFIEHVRASSNEEAQRQRAETLLATCRAMSDR